LTVSSEQGVVYASFIKDQLKAEMDRRASLDDRGAKLQQSASVTVGLFVTALGVLLGKDQRLAGVGLGLFASTVVLLVLSFLGGVVTTRLIKYEVAKPQTLARMLGRDHWKDSEATSRNNTAWLDVLTLQRMRPGNDFKAAALLVGIATQGFGVLLGVVTFGAVAAGTLLGGNP
jgi:hypothetical protein